MAQHENAPHAPHTRSHVHVSPVRTYLLVFGALLLGTGLTVWVAFQNLGILNDLVALTIAVVKMTLVVLFFMHVKYSSRLTKVVVVSGFLWLLILFSFTLADYWSRGWLGVYGK
jgi:cytochrome c oxidase subunit 4